MKKCCRNCGKEYTYNPTANFIIFCPDCNQHDFLECEYGYGPVVPCEIYYKNKEIAVVTYDPNDRNKYRIDSDYFALHKILDHTYLEALHEARDIIEDFINREQGMEKITLCGDNCLECPRYLAKTEQELQKVAELWHRVGWRDKVVSAEEMRCGGCSSHKKCTYQLVECVREHGVKKCSQCREFPCGKINAMLARSKESQEKCRAICTASEYAALEKSFFHKEENLKK